MELGFITVTLILVFIHFQQPFYIGVNSDNPEFQTTSMLLLVKDTKFITYKLPGDNSVSKFIVTPIQLTEDNYKQILIKDREIIDYLLDNYVDLMTLSEINKLKQYKSKIQKCLAGIDEMSSNDIVKMEYYIYNVYSNLLKKYDEDKKYQIKALAIYYKKVKNYKTMPKLENIKKTLLINIKKQYYLLKKWTHGMDYYYKNIRVKNSELIEEAEKLLQYNYIYNKAVYYYQIYKVLDDEKVIPKEMQETWDTTIQPLYTDFLRGQNIDLDVNMMEEFTITLLESLRSEALSKLNDAYKYTNEQEIIPFFEKGRALSKIKSLEDKLEKYNFNESMDVKTVKMFVKDYKTALNMKHTIKLMYFRDVIVLILLMIATLYLVITKGDMIFWRK